MISILNYFPIAKIKRNSLQSLRIGRNLRFFSPIIFSFFNFSYEVESPGDFFFTLLIVVVRNNDSIAIPHTLC